MIVALAVVLAFGVFLVVTFLVLVRIQLGRMLHAAAEGSYQIERLAPELRARAQPWLDQLAALGFREIGAGELHLRGPSHGFAIWMWLDERVHAEVGGEIRARGVRCEIISCLAHDAELSTQSGLGVWGPPWLFRQILRGRGAGPLLEAHDEALDFLASRGLGVEPTAPDVVLSRVDRDLRRWARAHPRNPLLPIRHVLDARWRGAPIDDGPIQDNPATEARVRAILGS